MWYLIVPWHQKWIFGLATSCHRNDNVLFQYKGYFRGIGILIIMIWRSWSRLILILSLPILLRRNLYIAENLRNHPISWWRHQMETFYALLAICAGNSPVPGEFPAQRPVTRNFDVFFDLRPNQLLSKQSWGWWFETPSRPLWRHRNALKVTCVYFTNS